MSNSIREGKSDDRDTSDCGCTRKVWFRRGGPAGFEAWTAATMFDAIKTTEQAADNAMP